MTRVWDVPVQDTTRIRDVRVAAEDAAVEAGLDSLRCASVGLVATELATNLLRRGGGGQVLIETVPHAAAGADTHSVQILALDHGPGISDLSQAFTDGFSSGSSLGIGLGTCRRLSDVFDLHGTPGSGTIALARLGAANGSGGPRPEQPVRFGGLHIPLAAAPVCGDAGSFVVSPGGVTVMLADGLGHGQAAAAASDAAVTALHRHPQLPPDELLGVMEEALRGTRGAAIAVARLDTAAGSLSFAGTGNIGARLRRNGAWDHLLSRPGVVGVYQHATPAEPQHRPWSEDAMLILHSDGLPSRWQPPADPAVYGRDPALTAAVVVRETLSAASPVRDDTALAVLAAVPGTSEWPGQ